MLLLFLSIIGCSAVPAKQTTEDLFNPSPEVFHRWQETGSFYALFEIVDAYIDPFTHKATKTDVLKYLGSGCDATDCYPNAGPRLWVYS